MADSSETPSDTIVDTPMSMSDLYAAFELRAKAELQLASYCEKLIVFGAGGVAGGVTVAAGIVTRLGRIEAYRELLISIVCMGLSTAGAILVHLNCSASSYIDLRIVASAKLDFREIKRMTRKRRSSSFQRWVRFIAHIGSRSGSLRAATRQLFATVVLGMLLFNGFIEYVIFVTANIRKFPH